MWEPVDGEVRRRHLEKDGRAKERGRGRGWAVAASDEAGMGHFQMVIEICLELES